jgi:Ala-tRNA(Pro) deacylase
MNMLKHCIGYLKRNGIRYSHSVHPAAYTAREVASADRMPAHAMMKTVVYSGDNGYGMLLLPADCTADFDEVRRLLGLTEIRLATEAELAALFPECEVGAMPPFGNLFNMPVLLDEGLATAEFFGFTAGTHRDVLHISGPDFHTLVNPLVASFAVKEAVGIP